MGVDVLLGVSVGVAANHCPALKGFEILCANQYMIGSHTANHCPALKGFENTGAVGPAIMAISSKPLPRTEGV